MREEEGLVETACESTPRSEGRGRIRSEKKIVGLEQAIRGIMDHESQQDPKFQTSRYFTRRTAKWARTKLIEQGFCNEELPSIRTLRSILNRMNDCLRPVLKSKPQKKIKETNAIFDNVSKARDRGARDSQTLQISIDTKAKVKVGPFSRRGKSRCQTPAPYHSKYNPIERCWGIPAVW
jgi:hypothetical protein